MSWLKKPVSPYTDDVIKEHQVAERFGIKHNRALAWTIISAALACVVFCITSVIAAVGFSTILAPSGELIYVGRAVPKVGNIVVVGGAGLILLIFNLVMFFGVRSLPKISTSIIAYVIDITCMSIIVGFAAAILGIGALLTAIGIATAIAVTMGIVAALLTKKGEKIMRGLMLALIIVSLIGILLMIILNLFVFNSSDSYFAIRIALSSVMVLMFAVGMSLTIKEIKDVPYIDDQKIRGRFIAWYGFALYQNFSRIVYYLTQLIGLVRNRS